MALLIFINIGGDEMKVVNNNNDVIEVTETAYNLLYKDRGFEVYKPKSADSSTKKKVKTNGGTKQSK